MTHVHAALAVRFSPPEWACFYEVSNAAGWGRSRSADAIAMSLWPSRGLELHGVEVKVDRRDWLRELKDPAKAEPIARYCDRWWIAVSDEKIVRADELPPTWGLLVLRAGKLVQTKEAPKLEAVPLTRNFIACLLRRATETTVPKSVLKELVEKEISDRAERDRGGDAYQAKLWKESYDRLQAAVDAFEAASGITFSEWNAGKIGDAVNAILHGDVRVTALERAAKEIQSVHERVLAAAKGLREAQEKRGAT